MGRDNRIRISDSEKESLKEAMELWYDVPEEIPFGKAIGDFSEFILRDQGPPPEEAEDGE